MQTAQIVTHASLAQLALLAHCPANRRAEIERLAPANRAPTAAPTGARKTATLANRSQFPIGATVQIHKTISEKTPKAWVGLSGTVTKVGHKFVQFQVNGEPGEANRVWAQPIELQA